MNPIRNLSGPDKPDVKKLYEKRDVQGLIMALSNDDEHLRHDAIESLGYLHDKQAVEPLINVLTNDNKYLSYCAAIALGS